MFTYEKNENIDPNGLSGSPVFGITTINTDNSFMQFIGLVILAKDGEFGIIDGHIVFKSICHAAKGELE